MIRQMTRWALVLGVIGSLAMGTTAFARGGHGGGGHGGGGHGGGFHGGGGSFHGGGHMGGGGFHHGGGGFHHGGGIGGGYHHHGGGGVIIGGYGGYYGGLGYGYPWGYGYGYGSSYPGFYNNYYGNYYGSYPSYYGYSRPIIVNPAPRVIYASPSVVARPAVPSPDAMIKLSMRAGMDGTVAYKLNDYSYVMQPGFSQKFSNDRAWTISFDDGSGKTVSQTLTAGNYVFTKSDAGLWQLGPAG